MNVKIVRDDLIKYRENFLKLEADYRSWLERFLRDQAISFVKKAQRRTPVDTGFLKSNWTFSNFRWIGNTLSVDVYNDAYYASFVEYGHAKPYKSGAQKHSDDWVEGYFMLTITEEEISRALPKQWETEFMKFLKQGGIY